MGRTVRVLCCFLAALLLVLSLLAEIRTNAVRDALDALRQEVDTRRAERRLLEVRVAARLPIEEIERLAEEELGMRPCRPDQRVYLTLGES